MSIHTSDPPPAQGCDHLCRPARRLGARRRRTGIVLTTCSAVLAAAAIAGCTADRSEPTPDGPAAPTADAAGAVPLSELPGAAPLEPGRYVASIAHAPLAPVLPVLSVPPGYEGLEGGNGVHGVGDPERYVWVWNVHNVFTHPCKADAGSPPVGPSVADLANALAAQPLRAGADPVPVTVGGYRGLSVELAVPDDVDVSGCPHGRFKMWPGRWQELAGQVDIVWIVDVDGQRITFDASYMPTVSPDQVAELREMVATATFTPADGT